MKYLYCLFFCLFISFCYAQTQKECDELLVKAVHERAENNYGESLELLLKVKNRSQQKNWNKQLFLAINNIGVNYYMMLDYGEAIDNYLEAYKIALKNADSNEEMIVLNNIAILYSKEKQFSKAEEYFSRAYKIALENKDSLKIGLYAINLATVANEQKQVSKAKEYIRIAIPLVKNNQDLLLMAEIAQATNFYLSKEHEKAKSNALKLYSTTKNSSNIEAKSSILILLAQIFQEEQNISQATNYMNVMLQDIEMSIENKKDAYGMMAQLNSDSQNYKQAILYKDSVALTLDSINKIKNGRLFENSKIKFEVQNFQQKLSESNQRLKTERRIFYGFMIGLFLLLIFVFWAIRNHFIKLNQRKIIAERNEQIVQLELLQEKNEKLLLKQTLQEQNVSSEQNEERLRSEIELKNKQLTSKALNVAARNSLIEDIITHFSNFNEVRENHVLKEKVNELKSHLKKDSEWDHFFNHFEEVNQGFLKKLKEVHPNLNSNDLRFISYLYMNLSIKEISSLFNITPEACRKRKERISKKMNLSSEEDLYFYLSNI